MIEHGDPRGGRATDLSMRRAFPVFPIHEAVCVELGRYRRGMRALGLLRLFSAICFATSMPAGIFAETLAPASHEDEIRAFASILAMAQTASDRCADIVVSRGMLQKAPEFFHITADDEALSRAAIDLETKRLSSAIEAAPSLKAWCNEAFRAYGPGGAVLPDLLAR